MAPLALVRGNPETPALWDRLAPSLEPAGRKPVRLSPAGFGAAVPPDFQVTPAGYRDWLIGELERFGEPADVIEHDWGGVFAIMAFREYWNPVSFAPESILERGSIRKLRACGRPHSPAFHCERGRGRYS